MGFVREGRPLDACKVFDDMDKNGCSPNLVTYTSLVNGLCGRGLFEMGSGYLEEMVGKGMVPHFSVFDGLVKGFCGVGKVEEACRMMEVMLGLGVVPHEESWVVVVPGVCDDDREKLGEELVKVLRKERWQWGTKIL